MGQEASGHGCADRPASAAMPLYHAPVRLLTVGCLHGPGTIQSGPCAGAEDTGSPGQTEENRSEIRTSGKTDSMRNSLATLA